MRCDRVSRRPSGLLHLPAGELHRDGDRQSHCRAVARLFPARPGSRGVSLRVAHRGDQPRLDPAVARGCCARALPSGRDDEHARVGGARDLRSPSSSTTPSSASENIWRRLRQHRGGAAMSPTSAIVLEASLEARSPIISATLIMLLAVVPVFFLAGSVRRVLRAPRSLLRARGAGFHGRRADRHAGPQPDPVAERAARAPRRPARAAR